MISHELFYKNNTIGEKNEREWAHSLINGKPGLFTTVLETGFIIWSKEEAHNWAGPWDGRAALCIITNHEMDCDLKSKQEMKEHIISQEIYNMFNYPDRLIKNINREIISNQGDKCSRHLLTHEEYLYFIKPLMTVEERIKANEKIDERMQNRLSKIEYMVTIEKPIRIYLCGNDDTAYELACSKRKYKETIREIEITPSFTLMTEVLKFQRI